MLRNANRPDGRSFRVVLGFLAALAVLAPWATAQGLDPGLLEPACLPNDWAMPQGSRATALTGFARASDPSEASGALSCGGPVSTSSGVYLFSGEFFHDAVDLHVRGRGLDFNWVRTYRSRIGPNVGLGAGWDHSYNIRLVRIARGPGEAEAVRFPSSSSVEWNPPVDPAGALDRLRYCTLRSTNPANFAGPGTTVILDPEQPDTTTDDTDVPAPGRVFSYLILAKNGNRAGSLGAASDGTPRIGLDCGITGPDLVLHDGTGRQDPYTLQANGSWNAREFFREIDERSPDRYVVTFPDTSHWDFRPVDGSPAAGRIDTIVDRNGNALTFDYDAAGRLANITDTLGRDYVIGYDANGFLSAVTDFSGRQVRYDYYASGDAGGNFGDLKSATGPAVTGTPNGNDFPAGKTTVYTYSKGSPEPALNHNLLTVTDPKGQTFLTNVYAPTTDPVEFDFDRVVSQIWGDPNDRIDYVYVPVIPDPSNGFAVTRAIENDRVGNVTEFFYDELNRNVVRRDFTGRAPDADQPTTNSTNRPQAPLRLLDPPVYDSRWLYNEDSQALQIVFPNQTGEQLFYDPLNPDRRSQGNLLERCTLPGPLGGNPPVICEGFEYDDGPAGTNFVTRHVDGRGNETVHRYDFNGDRLRTIHRIPSIVEDFEYNPFGQRTVHLLPDNGSGHRRRDSFDYYTAGPQNGYLSQSIVDSTGEVLVITYEYDDRGNVISTTDPKGNETLRLVNALDQVVRLESREVDPSGARYQRDLFYDPNDNVVRVDTQNVDDQGVVQPNSHLTTIHEYDLLDRPLRTCREADPYTGPIPGLPAIPTCNGLPAGGFLVEEYEYDANRNRTLIRLGEATQGSQPDNVVRLIYDERDLLFQETRGQGGPDPSTTQYDYDGNGNVTHVHHGLEDTPHVRLNVYDGYDRLIETTDPMENRTSFEYDANDNRVHQRVDGEPVDVSGGAGNVRQFEEIVLFDEMDRPRQTTRLHFDDATQAPILDGESNSIFDWSDNSQLVVHIDDNGNQTTIDYDTVNRRARVTDARSNAVSFEYDANSNVVRQISIEKSDPGVPDEIFVTSFRYDGLDRRVATTDNVGNVQDYRYDSRGNLTSQSDALRDIGGPGNETRHQYDGADRRILTEHVLTDDGTGAGVPVDTIVLTQQWDASSRIVARGDDNGNVTRYEYDGLNRLVFRQYEDGTTQSLTYDAHDFPVLRVDANGTTTEMRRDLNDRLIGRDVTPAPGVVGTTFETFDYDGLSRLIGAQDDDSVITRRYDSLSNLIEETLDGQTTGFDHDGIGNRLQTRYPGGRAIDYSYDALNRLATVEEGLQAIAVYDYVGPHRVLRRNYGNGTEMLYQYDGLLNPPGDFGVKQVVRTLHRGIFGPIDDRIYHWDPMYNKTLTQDITPGGQGRGRAYSYDSRYRLLQSDHFDAAGPQGFTGYEIDGVNNRIQVGGGPDAGRYALDPTIPDPADQQTNQYSRTPFDTRTYDANGNLVLIDAGTATQREIAYDYANRMVQSSDAATGLNVDYQYDALGRRTARTVTDATTSDTTTYTYDGWRVSEEQDGAGSTRASYVYGRDLDEVLTMRRGAADFYYHGDEQHNVVAVTTAVGNVVERYEYEDFGEPRVFNAAGVPLPGSTIENPYLFNGRRFDPETGWYYYRNRYLDPRAGRFTTRDSLGLWGDPSGLGNTYVYAAGNPATHEDPLGEAIFVKIPPVVGDVTTAGWSKQHEGSDARYFVADSFSFGVEREMKESGEKGGTEDINIGVGELQECTISKSMDAASTTLAQYAINGNSLGTAEIEFVEVAGGGGAEGKPICYLKYKLDRCFVKSWSTSGDADDRPTEEVAFYYNKIALTYQPTVDGTGSLSGGNKIGGFSKLAPVAINGNSCGTAEIEFVEVGGGGASSAESKPLCYLRYKLDRCFVKSWSISGAGDDRPTEEVAFYYNKIAFD